MIDASVLRKKLNELTPNEITALEARLVTDACADGEEAQADFFGGMGGGRSIEAT
jgi:hypothetical protein